MHHKFYQGSIDKGSLDFTMTPAATPPPSSLAFSQSQLRPADRVGLWVWWFACHLILLGILATTEIPEGDIRYYFSSLRGEFPDGLTEYPAVGTWPAHVVFWFSHRSTEHYLAMFGGFCMVIDGLFFVLLLNSGVARSRKSQILAAGFWAVFAVCTGHVAVQRLDLVPAVLVGVAALLLFYYPRISSALLGTATMIKLWPGVLAIGLVRGYRRKATYWHIAVFVGTIIGLSALVAMVSGVQRLLSPFTYQGVRGLQIESIAATPMIVRGAFGAAAEYSVTYAASKSYEITGPGVDAAIMVTNVLMLATLVFAVAWALRGFVKDTWSPDGSLIVWVTLIFMLLVANKVFSPQYILWLGPIMAVVLLRTNGSKYPLALAWLMLLMAVLGQIVYPYYYDDVVHPGTGTLGVIGLAIRNGLMVVSMIVSLMWAISHRPAANAQANA